MQRRPRLTLALVVAAVLAASWTLRLITLNAVEVGPTPVFRAVLSDPDAPAAGAARPDLTIVIFTDYQCPICKATDPALERLLARDRGVRVVFKDWPILGPMSQQAARLAVGAARQGKYAAFHQALMANRSPLTIGRIEEIAVAVGLDWPRLLRDTQADSAAIDQRLRRNGSEAWALGLQGTPGYLVGPLRIEGGLDDIHLTAAVWKARWAQRTAAAR